MFAPPNDHSPVSRRADGPSRSGEAAVAELQHEVERLRMVTEALWRILREKHGLDEQELVRQITALDLEDGKFDGRVATQPPKPCPKCGRTLSKSRPRCLFCGEPIAQDPFQR
jgi:hypothetical protein